MRSNTIVGSACLISLLAMVACAPSQSLDAAAKEPDQPALELQAAAQPAPEAMAVEAPQSAKAIQPKSPAARAAKPAAAPNTVVATATAEPADATLPAKGTPAMESRSVATKHQDEESIATTIGGCLVHDDGMFKLKDTDGDHAPKSRSWKSGFIKKGPARIELVDASHRVDFTSHVGYRVNVSGMLADREMQVRSIKGGTERCD